MLIKIGGYSFGSTSLGRLTPFGAKSGSIGHDRCRPHSLENAAFEPNGKAKTCYLKEEVEQVESQQSGFHISALSIPTNVADSAMPETEILPIQSVMQFASAENR